MQRCSVLSAAVGEPMAGTAPVALRWMCLEHPPPWGRDVVDTDPVLAELAGRAAAAGTRLTLLRPPGHGALTGRRRVFLAHTTPGSTRLSALDCATPAELLDLDLGADELPGTPLPGTLALVCTHGRRDRCCALAGRALAAELPAAHECSHLGGHRFAPNAALLPSGYLYGRLDGGAARDVLTAAATGEVRTAGCRGRSTWGPAGQVAELAVRELTGELRADTLAVGPFEASTVTVTHVDGRAWQVRVEAAPLPGLRPSSCGAEATPVFPLVATGVTPAAPAAMAGRAPR